MRLEQFVWIGLVIAVIGVVLAGVCSESSKIESVPERKYIIVQEKGMECRVFIDDNPYDNIYAHPKVCTVKF
jgi:hypothetical protein